LEKVVKNGDHHQIWELGRVLQRLIIPEKKPYFFLNLSLQPKNMPKGLLKKTALFFAEKSGIDLDLIADLLSKARELMSEAQSDSNHPIRNKFDVWMLDFNNLRLAMKIHKPIQNLKERVMQHVEEEKSYRTF
jgi:hypothetical protein